MSTPRTTPETDAHEEAMELEDFDVELAKTYTLARKLERERDEAREALEAAVAYPVTGNWHEQATAAIAKAKGGKA